MWPKPRRGSGTVERHQRSHERKLAEDKVMRSAKVRDRHFCRRPFCPHRNLDLPMDPCHRVHRGMGGNPKLDRTTRQQIITLCRLDHQAYDAEELLIDPLDEAREFDGPCSFRERDPKTNAITFIGAERTGPHS